MWRAIQAAPFLAFIRSASRNSFSKSSQFGIWPIWSFSAFCTDADFTVARKVMAEHFIRKAGILELDAAFRIVEEYYDAVSVIARDRKGEFQEHYFGERGGVWLASLEDTIVGCIALRELPELARSGEVKRMYVQPAHRQHGIAQALLDALERFAANAGYEWLYLDSAPGMDTAVRFYQRSGYEPCPRYNNNPQANIYLRKRIR
jgi:GNAT superfamily N-acetyltransferase